MLELLLLGRSISSPGTLPESSTAVNGQKVFAAASGTEVSWVVPAGVYDICTVAVGAGQSGTNTKVAKGGNGGDLRWGNRIPVTPGETLLIKVGIASNGDTYLKRASTILLIAKGGLGSTASTAMKLPFFGGGNGGLGGDAFVTTSPNAPGGGGGAGGYSGPGGNGGNQTVKADDGQGGGGSGGSGWRYNNVNYGAGGGGVGLLGEGDSGLATNPQSSNTAPFGAGRGGSGSADSTSGPGVGLGAGAGSGGSYLGGNGGLRIIWGKGRAFPSTLTTDMS